MPGTMPGDPFYQSPAWKAMRARVLREAGYRCELCGADIRGFKANTVDHKVRRRLRPDLALERTNLWALCTHCHNAHKQAAEATGRDMLPPSGLPEGW